MTLRVVDLADDPHESTDLLIAAGDPTAHNAEFWLERATFTLLDTPAQDRRTVVVPSVEAAVEEIAQRVAHRPQAAAVCDDVLRAVDPLGPAFPGIVAESLAYSTLQAGGEFATWLAERGPARAPDDPDPVIAERDGDTLHVRFNRPSRHNAFSTPGRAALLEALEVARVDPSVTRMVLTGNGRSFCSGGDLAEFGSFADPATAHLARTRHSPALVLDEITRRLGGACRAEVHGQVLGSGLEMAAFCGYVTSAPDATFGLPELALGLIPGAGGTVSVTRRIGRWRTAYLVLSGQTVTPAVALQWGLVDEITAVGPDARSPH